MRPEARLGRIWLLSRQVTLSRLRLALLACVCALACVDRPSIGVSIQTSSGSLAPALPAQSMPELLVRPWREAAEEEDWRRVAQAIDRLPTAQQREPGARYARAVAAAELGDPEGALQRLQALELQLPELREQIEASRAAAQLEVGPFEAAASYYADRKSPRDWLASARAWRKARRWSRARRELDRLLDDRKAKHSLIVEARELRAAIAQQQGQQALARRDWYWLAVEEARAGADSMYEQLAGAPLSKAERLRRACALARRGKVSEVLHELARMRRAPGKMPPAAAVRRCVAHAHYAARDYARAAPLLEQTARAAGDPDEWFLAAEAWIRARQPERAARLYRMVARRQPDSQGADKATYLLARLHYRLGAWNRAEQAYNRYLRRAARHRGGRHARFADTSRYERAIARLAAGRLQAARRDLDQLGRGSTRSCSLSLLRHLEAVAALESNSSSLRARAVDELKQVMHRAPLSFAALSSSARLEQLGHAPPQWPTPPTAANDWETPPELPTAATTLAELGLYSAAESAIYSRQSVLSTRYSPRGGEALCRQYGALDRGFRRYAWARSVLRGGILLRPPRPDTLWAWRCLYPRPFSAPVARLEARYHLPSGLLYAVMRAESAFRSDARSPAGAVGLLQLMPATAARVAQELAMPADSRQLWRPAHNLRLGAHYLNKLLRSFDGHVALALASYNAGPRAVERWLDSSDALPLDLWVARIPFRETRSYVQGVLANWARYRYLQGEPIPKLQLELPSELQVPSELF